MEEHEKAIQVYQTLLYRWALRYSSLHPVAKTIEGREETVLSVGIAPVIETFSPVEEFRSECSRVGLSCQQAREWLSVMFSRDQEIQTYHEFLQVVKTSSWVQSVYLKMKGNWIHLHVDSSRQDYLDVIEYILILVPDLAKVRLWVEKKELYVES